MATTIMQGLNLEQRRSLQGTKYSFNNPSTIATGAEWYQNFESVSQLRKHLPLDNVVVTNNSTQDIDFYPNDDTRFKKKIVKGTIQSFSKSTIGGLNQFRVVNLGSGNINANEVEVFVEKEQPNTQRLIDGLVNRFPRLFLG